MSTRSRDASWVRTAALLACTLAVLSGAVDAIAARRTHAHLIGVVLPRDARPGDRISASAVTDPEGYQDVPGLRVIALETGGTALDQLAIDLGDGRKQPASGPLLITVPHDSDKLPVSLERGGRAIASEQVALNEPGAYGSRTSRGEFTMPSICEVDRVQAIRGPFGGDSTHTSIEVAGSRAQVLAESPRAAYFEIPDDVNPGAKRINLRDGGNAVSLDVQMVGIQLSADKLALHAGEDTNFTARVTGLKPHTASWRAGSPSELYDLSGSPPGVTAPAPGEPGKLVLEIENLSPEIVTMTGATGGVVVKDVYPEDAIDGSYTYRGHLHADQAGTFNLSAEAFPFVADQVGQPEPGTVTPRTEATPRAHRTEPVARRTERVPHEEETQVVERDLGPPTVWVPEIPLVAPPKCCVITSITVTNNFEYPVYYVINGKYVSWMAPPPADWVKPGASRTFNGDFGRCVRIEAFQNRGYDANGDPQTGLFDDERICCDQLVSGKAKHKRFSFTINSIEFRDWRDCPDVVGVGPRRTPTTTPTRTGRRRRPRPPRRPQPKRRRQLQRPRPPQARR